MRDSNRRGSKRAAFNLLAIAAIVVLPTLATTALSSDAFGASTPAGSGWIRFGHFVSLAPPVDVKVDGTVIGTDIGFRDVTGYVLVHDGSNTVSISSSAAGPNSTPLATITASVPDGGAVTVAAFASTGSTTSGTGTVAGGVTLSTFTDDLSAPPSGDAKVRVIHTIPGAPVVDTTLTSTSGSSTPSVSLSPVGYKQASPYVPVAAGTYDVVVKAGTTTVTQGNSWQAVAGTVTTIVIVEASSGPTLEILSDAVGTSTTPNGSMQTGYGGTAGGSTNRLARDAILPLGIALVLLLLAAVTMRSRMGRRLVITRNP